VGRRPFQLRVRAVIESYTAASPIGAELIDIYAGSLSADGSESTQDREIALLRELCRLFAAHAVAGLSIDMLDQLAELPAASPSAALKRKRVVRRLIRLLQHRGDLPASWELRWNRNLRKLVEDASPASRPMLKHWLAQRQSRVSPYELYHEGRRLLPLEDQLQTQPGRDDDEAISAWLQSLVRQVVGCPCAPVTRSADGKRCLKRTCRATTATHALVPSPGLRKQAALRSLARRYLRQRREWTEMSDR
jgi:hypothetical protein